MRFLYLLVIGFFSIQLNAQGLERLDLLGDVDREPVIEMEWFAAEELESIGKIVASWRQAEFLTNEDIVYLNVDRPVSPGDVFSVYQDHGKVKASGSFFGSDARRYQILGMVRVTGVKNDVVEARIMNANDQISRGHLIGPVMKRRVEIKPQQPSKMVRGEVISPAEMTNLTGTHHFSILNKGTKDGLKVNDTVFIYTRGHKSRGVKATLPEVNIATLVVVHATENFSTAYNLTGIDTFESGATFKSAIDEVQYLNGEAALGSSE